MLTGLIQALINGIGGLLDLATVLPQSPFQNAIKNIKQQDFFGYIAYFFPMNDILVVLQLWLVAIAFFYLIKTLLRWMKVIQ